MSISAQSSSKRIEIITLTVALNSAKCCQKRTLGGSMHWKKLLYRIISHQAIHCGASVCMSAKVIGRQNEVFLHCIQMYHNSMSVYWLIKCCLARMAACLSIGII